MNSKFNIIYVAALFSALVLQVAAHCCNACKSASDMCADGTMDTPCCGVGSCNIFCCNCSHGCRQGDCTPTYSYCVDEAGQAEDLCIEMACDGNPQSCQAQQIQCAQAYNQDVKNCAAEYPQVQVAAAANSTSLRRMSRRRVTGLLYARNGTESTTDDDSDVVEQTFNDADNDGDNKISYAEFIAHMNTTKENGNMTDDRLVIYLNHFAKYDEDVDGFITLEEAKVRRHANGTKSD